MSRRHSAKKRLVNKDVKYSSHDIEKFANYLMLDGKKAIARKIVYKALETLKTKYSKNPLETFMEAISNLKPLLEVRPIRVGGSTYQVPCALEENRSMTLSMKWLLKASRARSETTMHARLAEEIFDAVNNRGSAIKIKDDNHKMAEANRSYSHFSPKKRK